MCMMLPPKNLNLDLYSQYSTSIYTCKVITTPRVHSGKEMLIRTLDHIDLIYLFFNVTPFIRFLWD